MKKLLAFLVGVLVCTSLHSQIGSSCSMPKTFNEKFASNFNSQFRQIEWYSFTARTTNPVITLYNSSNAVNKRVHSMRLWEGLCPTLSLLAFDTLSGSSDSILVISSSGLAVGNTYYLQFDKTLTANSADFYVHFKNVLDGGCTSPIDPCQMVSNGDFEEFGTPPAFPGDIGTVGCWYAATGTTPDYFNVAGATSPAIMTIPTNEMGFQVDHSGNDGYIGLITYEDPLSSAPWHEYVRQTLLTPLTAGQRYIVSFWVSLADTSTYATNRMGMWLTDLGSYYASTVGVTTGSLVAPANPQIVSSGFITNKTAWTQLTDTISATGTETEIIIGNFGNSVLSLGLPTFYTGLDMAFYYVDDVSIIKYDSIYTVVSDADSTICNGDTLTIETAFADTTITGDFYWVSFPLDSSLVGQDSLSLITVAPNDTTIYIVEVTTPMGCTIYDTVQINVVPLPAMPDILGDSIICTQGDTVSYTIANFDSTLIYSVTLIPVGAGGTVSPIDSLGVFQVIYNDTQGDTLLITVADSLGCDSVAVFIVKSCCIFGDTTFLNDSASHMIAHYGTSAIVSQNFSINGTLTIDANIVWNLCNVKLGPDAVINILPTKTLYLTQTTQLSACTYMWDRIRVNPGATLRMDANSIIEDAKIAIYSIAGGTYTLDNARLNRNLKHMELTSYSGTHPGTIRSSSFTCQPILGVLTTLNSPYSGYRTQVGIEINGVTSVTIGSSILPAHVNRFRNMNVGILSNRSSVTVLNNIFNGITNGTFPNTGIAAIKATGNPIFPFPYVARNLTVGDNLTSGLNDFRNCINGIVTEQNMNVSVQNNDFQQIEDHAMYITRNGKNNGVLIENNDIVTTRVGVRCVNNTLCTTNIRENVMDNMKNFSSGVWIQEMSSSSIGAIYTVHNNLIKTVEYGIRGENLYHATIDNNYIETEPYVPFFLQSTGIRVNGNSGTRIISNNIKTVPVTYAQKNGGIFADLSPGSFIACNTVRDMGYGIKCSQNMLSDVFNNSMNNDFYGLVLDNNGFIGVQDNPIAPGQPSYNKWANIPVAGSPLTSKRTVTSNFTNGSMSPIIYRTGSAAYNPNPTAALSGSVFFTLTPTGSGPIFSPLCVSDPPPTLLSQAEDIALENMNFVVNDANTKWLGKQGLLVNIVNDSIDISGSAILQAFVTQSSTENMGKLKGLDLTLTNPGKYNAIDMTIAQSLNNSISPNNDIETNHKMVNEIVINSFLSNSSFNATQIADLRLLANKCPYTDGLGVYEARVLLAEIDSIGTIYYNPCEYGEEDRMSIITSEPNDESTPLMVYPNPAIDQIKLTYRVNAGDLVTFEIYNIIGEKVMSQRLNSSEEEFSISTAELTAGVYTYKYSINGKSVNTNKLVIVK